MGIFSFKTLENKTIVTIEESIYPDNGGEFGEILINAANEGMKTIILDMSKVEVIYSSGITELVKANVKAKEKGVKIVLVRTGEVVMKILKLCGFDKLFAFADSIEEVSEG